jgi:hypothetical protein
VIRITAEYKDNKENGRLHQDKMVNGIGRRARSGGEIAALMGSSTHAYGGTRMGDNRRPTS